MEEEESGSFFYDIEGRWDGKPEFPGKCCDTKFSSSGRQFSHLISFDMTSLCPFSGYSSSSLVPFS